MNVFTILPQKKKKKKKEKKKKRKDDKNPSDQDNLDEEKDLRKSKKGRYYSTAIKVTEKLVNCIEENSQRTENRYHNGSFSNYLLNNWIRLAPLWTKFHVGNQSRHRHSEPYTNWALSYQNFDAIVNPPTTQGIIELRNKLLKHVYLNGRIYRIDRIV